MKTDSKTDLKTDVTKLVTFQLGTDMFAADVFSVDRVLRFVPPSSVPDVPLWIEGVMEHRGKVIPVVDMRRRIQLTDTSVTPDTRTLIFTTADGWVGAIVDAVHEVVAVPAASITPPPPLFRGLSGEFVRGIAKVRDQLIVVLDVDRVLASGDRIAFESVLQSPAGVTAAAEAAVRG